MTDTLPRTLHSPHSKLPFIYNIVGIYLTKNEETKPKPSSFKIQCMEELVRKINVTLN